MLFTTGTIVLLFTQGPPITLLKIRYSWEGERRGYFVAFQRSIVVSFWLCTWFELLQSVKQSEFDNYFAISLHTRFVFVHRMHQNWFSFYLKRLAYTAVLSRRQFRIRMQCTEDFDCKNVWRENLCHADNFSSIKRVASVSQQELFQLQSRQILLSILLHTSLFLCLVLYAYKHLSERQ